VEDEAQPLGGGGPLVLPDHAAVCVRGALRHVLAAHEGEAHGPWIVLRRGGEGAAGAAREAVLVDEAVPVDPRRREPRREHAAGPVGVRGEPRLGACDDARERGVLGDLDPQRARPVFPYRRPPRPQDDAVRVGSPDATPCG
jgi:hypothetical protein